MATFLEHFTRHRLERMFPHATMHRSNTDDTWIVRIPIGERELATLYDEERKARFLNERITPRINAKKRHWSLQRARKWAPA